MNSPRVVARPGGATPPRLLAQLLIALVVALSAIVAAGVVSPAAALAEEPSVPKTSKTLTDNGDGTYLLNLSVTGAASMSTEHTKANVVIVMDVSGSMNFHDASATGGYGVSNGSYIELYDAGGNRVADGYTGTVYYRNWQGNLRVYYGTRYTIQTRLDIAKSATDSLVRTLAANNASADDDTVEITFETFASYANTDASSYGTWYAGNDMSDLLSAINGLSAEGGTNWDDALHDATAVAQAKDDGDPTYYIFVSDGDPTFYMNSSHTQRYGNGSDTTSNELNAAYAEAETISGNGYHFYGVGAFGTVDTMRELSNRAGGAYYSATDSASLNEAFAEIISSITNSANFQNVKVTDGVTAGTSSVVLSSGTGATDFMYTITGPDGIAHVVVLGEDGTIATVDGGTPELSLTDMAGNTLTLAPGRAFPAATASDGTVQWDLSSLGQLLDGYTYTVSFKVWPSQDAYDTIAKLQNGILTWDEVDQTQFTRTQGTDGAYAYALKTNTGASVSYTAVKTKDGEVVSSTDGTAQFDDVPAITLRSTTMDVQKAWVGESPKGTAVELELYVDGVATGKTFQLSAENNWRATAHIAPGLTVSGETLEPGHDYTLVETSAEDYNYQFVSGTSHPMLVDSATEITNPDGTSASVLVGTNVRKSTLDIAKEVTDISSDASMDADTTFAYDVQMTTADGGDAYFAVYDADGDMVTDAARVTGATQQTQDGAVTGVWVMASGDTVTVRIKGGERVHFAGLLGGSTYTVTEKDIPTGYAVTSVLNDGADAATDVAAGTAAGTIAQVNAAYAVVYTNTYDAAVLSEGTGNPLQVTKAVTGRDATEAFDFALTPDATTQAAIARGDVKVADGALAATTSDAIAQGATETVSFGKVTFYKEGTYVFTADETTEKSDEGWTYDASTKDITVTVAKDDTGKLVATVEGNDPTFTNAYEAQPVTLTGDTALRATKAVTGRDATEQFSFSLTPAAS
ncbi:hypothetical protein I3I95_07950, partial [bacterium]|nr:hypothetical protein [bacterium]